MRDTSDEIETKFRHRLLARSGAERLKMGCSMHAAARALVIASIPERDPVAVNQALFLRFYGDEFEPKRRKRILLALRKAAENDGKRTAPSKRPRNLMRKILKEDEVRLLSRRLRKVTSPIFGEPSSRYTLDIEDIVRFEAVATRLREARERRSMDLKAAAKALAGPQYRLRDIEQCHLKNLKPSALRQYIDFLGLRRWFARWLKANSKLAARLGLNQESAINERRNS